MNAGNSMNNIYRGVFLIIFTGFLSVFLASCTVPDQKEVTEKKYEGPLMESHDAVTIFSDSSKPSVKLSAPLQQRYQNGDRVFPEGVNILFYNSDGTVKTTLRANKGKHDNKTQKYTVTGNVVVVGKEDGRTLKTEELNWDPNSEKIYTDKFVEILTKDEILTGEGLSASQDFSSYKILKPTGIFSLDENEDQ